MIHFTTRNLSNCARQHFYSKNCIQNFIHDRKWWREFSTRRPNFITQLVDNIKQELEKSKDMNENIKKFRVEAQKLEQSDALKAARQKFNSVESEATKSSEVLSEKIEIIKDKVQDVIHDASKSEIGRKASKLGEEFSKSARDVSDTISEHSYRIGRSETFQKVSAATKIVKNEINPQGIHGRVYQSPVALRKRKEITHTKTINPNINATDIELHKDSKIFQSWENFKNNNAYINKVLDWKIKYDESDNPIIKASRLLTDKISDIMGNMFSKNDLSETLTEICKIDPTFDQKQFLRDCENDFIPNILEAIVRGDLPVLKDWCFEGTYNLIAKPIQQMQAAGYALDSKILDIENIDLVMGKVMDQGPVLIITFQSQQIVCVRDKQQNVVEGNPEKVMRVNYVWVLCREPNELNPKFAWRLMELSANSTEQLV